MHSPQVVSVLNAWGCESKTHIRHNLAFQGGIYSVSLDGLSQTVLILSPAWLCGSHNLVGLCEPDRALPTQGSCESWPCLAQAVMACPVPQHLTVNVFKDVSVLSLIYFLGGAVLCDMWDLFP